MRITAFIALFFAAAPLFGAGYSEKMETDFFDFERATLEEALGRTTSVSSLIPVELRRTPGQVAIITREEIQAAAPRNLIDVLRLIPEIEFGADEYGALGMSVRGLWAQDGKVLLLWDGVPGNELLFTKIQYDKYPVDQIERIEIIKGPGSVIYGGYAELAVINIVTRNSATLKGTALYGAYGQGPRARARTYAGYNYAAPLGQDKGELTAAAHWEQSQRSDARFMDDTGISYSMKGRSDIRPRQLNLSGRLGGLSARFMQDNISLSEIDGAQVAQGNRVTDINFSNQALTAQYEWRVSDRLTVTPRAAFYRATPWNFTAPSIVFNKSTHNSVFSALASYAASDALSLAAGGEYSVYSVETGTDTSFFILPALNDRQHFENKSVFGNATITLGPTDINAGLRYDRHTSFAGTLVPRVALVYNRESYILKAIYSGSFRAPSTENMRTNASVKPEKTTTAELEAGFMPGRNLYISANAARTIVRDPIARYTPNIFGVPPSDLNYERIGADSAGFSLKYKDGALYATLGYSYYTLIDNRVDLFDVPGHGSSIPGIARHKAVANASIPLGTGLKLNPSFTYLSRRYSVTGPHYNFKDEVEANLGLQQRDVLAQGLTLTLAVKDMFNHGHEYIQPYAGGHPPLPGMGREFLLKVSYEF